MKNTKLVLLLSSLALAAACGKNAAVTTNSGASNSGSTVAVSNAIFKPSPSNNEAAASRKSTVDAPADMVVESVVFAKDDGNNQAGEAVESFKPSDGEFTVMHLNKVNPGMVVTATYIQSRPNGDVKIAEFDVPIKEKDELDINTNVSAAKGFVVGNYKIEYSVNGKVFKTAPYKVVAD